ncbi:phage holin family protein [uncultured Arthrobacter sp.]|uniref:phage holin family protein n=1 Tax=uncultured Arthrobacter sp. TaxID=114050 RepID=UPI0025F452A6|nr:phage holin family protein [uncultured Arthrobacter sp.]
MSDAYTGGAHSAAPPPPSEAEQRAANNSVGELLSDVTRNLSTLMRQEVALAKAELTESGKNAGKGAGMFAGAAVGGHFVLLFLSLALMWGLDVIMPIGWAAVIVAVIWGIIAAILAAMGKKEMKQIRGLPTTAETVKEIPPTLKPGEQTP